MAIARENDNAKGTSVPASYGHYIGIASGQLKPVVEYEKIEPAQGRIEAGIEQHIIRKYSELAFSAPVKSDWLGHILTGIFGSVSSNEASGETAIFDHTITVANNSTPPAYSLYMLDDVQSDLATYGIIKKLELKENSTVKDLLIELNLNPTIVLVTRNNQLTPEIVRLKNKDKLKILEVVSGG